MEPLNTIANHWDTLDIFISTDSEPHAEVKSRSMYQLLKKKTQTAYQATPISIFAFMDISTVW